ncbi:MAG: PGF-CTERM sorting domain-containing protein, partial [Candidatus Poseidoniaceae archaeon]
HYLTCDLIRESTSESMGTWTSEEIQVIDDTSNQDDATIVVGATMNLQEAWGTVTIDAIDLDAGQEYTLDWVVEDHSLSPPTIMMQNDHIWVAGNDGTYTYELEFHDLADTTDACITVVFTAGDDELQVVDNVCWMSASTADGDGDGVYDKNDLCPDTSAGLAVTADGCSDSDNDGFDTDLEIDCNTDPNDALSFPTDLDNDGTCDYLDTDTDGDGYLDVDELAAGTDPFDPLSKPANQLPECAIYYNLEIDGIPTSFDGEAAIPALSGVTATTAAASLTPTTVTIPAGSYYITAHCIDPDGDDVTVTVNDITVGPVAGEVSGAVLIEIGEDVDETMDVQITWSDGTDSLTALVTVELDGGSPGLIPGFGAALTFVALLGAGFVLVRKDD